MAAEAGFGEILSSMLPLLGFKIDRKWSPSALKIRAPSVEAIFGHLKASWGGFELDFGLILKAFFAAPGEACYFAENRDF